MSYYMGTFFAQKIAETRSALGLGYFKRSKFGLAKEESDDTGKYQEPVGPATVGVKTECMTLFTRPHTWTFHQVRKGTAGKGARSAALAAPARPRPALPSLEFCQ